LYKIPLSRKAPSLRRGGGGVLRGSGKQSKVITVDLGVSRTVIIGKVGLSDRKEAEVLKPPLGGAPLG